MAKAPFRVQDGIPERDDGVQSLAESLFVKSWQPGQLVLGKDPTAFAAMCFAGAKVFLKVASRVREGESPEEIISPPEVLENVSVTESI